MSGRGQEAGLVEWGGVLPGEWVGPGGGASGMGRSLTG